MDENISQSYKINISINMALQGLKVLEFEAMPPLSLLGQMLAD